MYMKKKTCILLALLIVLLTACGTGKTSETIQETNTSTQPVETETERIYPNVEGVNYGGAEVRTIHFNPGPDNGYSAGFYFQLDVEEESGDVLMDSIYIRNRNVEENLNIDLTFTGEVNADNMMNTIRAATMGGTGEFDLIVPYLREYPNLVNEDLVLDLNTFDVLDFTSPWWDSKSADELMLQNKLYGVVSDWTIADKMSNFCIFFSKQLVDDFGIENPYQLVLDGKWTLDYMLEKAQMVASDLNGNGERDLEDRFGILSDQDLSYALFHAGGWKLAENGTDGIPQITIHGEQEITALQRIYEIFTQDMFLSRQFSGQMTMQEMAQIFANGQVLYFAHIPEALQELRQSDNDFGIIPFPKYDSTQQEYITPLTHWAATFTSIPTVTTDADRAAVVLNILAAESCYELMPSLYEVVLDVKYTRDEESAQMLDIIFDTRTYDIGNICNFGGIADLVLGLRNTPDIVSSLAARKEKAQTDLEKFIEELGQE